VFWATLISVDVLYFRRPIACPPWKKGIFLRWCNRSEHHPIGYRVEGT